MIKFDKSGARAQSKYIGKVVKMRIHFYGKEFMQAPVIMAFRARLIKAGYTHVSIKRKRFIDQQLYLVKAVDPLGAIQVKRFMSIEDMYVWR